MTSQPPVIVRIAPSPTGFLHIGTARTALFNYLYAKHTGGQFLLRIEDTDRARSTQEATDALIRDLKWLGMDWDGDAVSQFARGERHKEVAYTLLNKGAAYKCYTTAEELAVFREANPHAKFQSPWRDRTDHPDGAPYSIRIKAPRDAGDMVVDDQVQGRVRVAHDELDDFIILRSDGIPVYLLAVVVDDHDMDVTHVIRGDDHMTNTFRQNLIYQAMGWRTPVYAHVPLIHGSDGAKLSKRHGALAVDEYRKMGFLPEAICAYLLRLGWSHGDLEIIDRDQAIALFDLSSINKAPGRLDLKKMESVNAHYIKEADNNRLIDMVLDQSIRLPDAGRDPQETTPSGAMDPVLRRGSEGFCNELTARARLSVGMNDLKLRSKTIVQIIEESHFYLKNNPIDHDISSTEILRISNNQLLKIEKILANLSDWAHDTIEAACKELAHTDYDGKLAEVMKPLRAALTGRTVSPSLPTICVALGKEESLKRIHAAQNL